MSDIVQRIATKAVIVKDGKILLLREANTYVEGTQTGRFGMPGGRLNPGEPFQDGLKREVQEETGLDITIGQPIYVGEWHPVIKGVQNQIVAIFFLCAPVGDQTPRLSEEHDHYEWIEPGQASQFDIMDPEDKVVAEVSQLLS